MQSLLYDVRHWYIKFYFVYLLLMLYLVACCISDVYQGPNVSQRTDWGAVPAPPPKSPKSQNMWTRPIWEAPPRGEKRPSLKAFQLTKTLVEQRVKDNVIIVTFGNYAFMDFILTWVKHLTDLGISNLLVGRFLIRTCNYFLEISLFHIFYVNFQDC